MEPTRTVFSVRETAALAGVSERILRNEIERGVVRPARNRRLTSQRLEFDSAAITYFALIRNLGLPLSKRDRAALFAAIVGGNDSSWARKGTVLRRGALSLDLAATEREVRRRIALLKRGRRRTHRDPDILGGVAVFRGTRLPVQHIGGLVLGDVPIAEILTDYPTLDARDVEFARLFVEIGPRPGRPSRRLSFRRVA